MISLLINNMLSSSIGITIPEPPRFVRRFLFVQKVKHRLQTSNYLNNIHSCLVLLPPDEYVQALLNYYKVLA